MDFFSRAIHWFYQNFTNLYSICEVFNSNVKTLTEKHDLFVTYKIKDNIDMKHESLMTIFKPSNTVKKLNPSFIGTTSLRKGTKSAI